MRQCRGRVGGDGFDKNVNNHVDGGHGNSDNSRNIFMLYKSNVSKTLAAYLH